MERYILQPSYTQNYWICTDQNKGLVCKFEQGNFNDNQQFTLLEDSEASVQELAKFAREMGDWLRDNHYDKIF